MGKEPEIVKSGYDYEVLINYDHLQRAIRHPDYQDKCKDIIFDKEGFAIIDSMSMPDDTKNEKHQNSVNYIKERFGLHPAIDPTFIINEIYPLEYFSEIPIFTRDPFTVSLQYYSAVEDSRGNIILNPIIDGRFIFVNIDLIATYKKQIVSGVKSYISAYKKFAKNTKTAAIACETVKQTAGFIRFKIDLFAKEKDLFAEIKKHIKPHNERFHPKRSDYYKIWDVVRNRNIGYKKIALELAKEGIKIAPETVRKRYLKAYQLIIGEDPKYTVYKYIKNFFLESRESVSATTFNRYRSDDDIQDHKVDNKILDDTPTRSIIERDLVLRELKNTCRSCDDVECCNSVLNTIDPNHPSTRIKNRQCEILRDYADELAKLIRKSPDIQSYKP